MEISINNIKGDASISISFNCGYAGSYTYNFTHNCGHESYAGLVAEAIDDQFQRHIKAIRQNAYAEGWDDKKKRRTRRTDFDWCPNAVRMERFN